ncbi:hypothetical protein GLW36_16410 [Halorubrum terrestre]|uniref:Uncharacterized protein n=1 Tax=Halorubrum distributum TaxID=29283 RepID=A0A6B1IBG4_9EURY|nr:hypothetical protein [Halorubrum terrestre]MYL18212.1 hypothetical protein [Halorubrum terrestre]
MSTGDGERQYRLKLKEGDKIQATITGVGSGTPDVDTSGWTNIDTASLAEASENTTIAPGSRIYTKVADITGSHAQLVAQRGVYQRNHLPGDEMRTQATKQVSASLCEGELNQERNLDSLFIVGVATGADVTIKIAKIRGRSAIGLPVTVHDPGLASGREVLVETTANSTQAKVLRIADQNHDGQLPDGEVPIKLSQVAKSTGKATVEVSGVTSEGITGTIVDLPAELPTVGDTFQTSLKQGRRQTTVSWSDADIVVEVEFDDPCPITGTASIELTEQVNGKYRGNLITYTHPDLSVGETYSISVYKSKNGGTLKIGGQSIPIKLVNSIDTTGEATVKIVEISDTIYGKIVGEISRLNIDDAESSSVDLTNLSKL